MNLSEVICKKTYSVEACRKTECIHRRVHIYTRDKGCYLACSDSPKSQCIPADNLTAKDLERILRNTF